MSLLEAVIAAKISGSGGGGGGGSVTPGSIVTATGQMTEQQAAETRGNLGAEPEKFVVTVTDDGQGNLSADKTLVEMYSAYEAGKSITLFGVIPLTGMEYVAGVGGYACFSWCTVNTNGGGTVMQYTVEYDGNSDIWNFTTSDFNESQHKIAILGSVATITPYKNNIYTCSTLTSLTISNPPATGAYSIVFTSGSTATTTTIPATILGLEDFAAEANTLYEINVLDNRAVVGSWEVSA